MDIDHLKQWIGRSESTEDFSTPSAYARLSAVLDHEQAPWQAGAVPPLGHWLNFLPDARQSSMGVDGHPAKGGFLPPVPLPRRMWAGSRLTFPGTLPVGEKITRVSTIKDVVAKSGASGSMVFVTVLHETSSARGLAITEEQDLVYREPAAPAAPSATPAPKKRNPAPAPSEFTRTIHPDPVLLFRYSALTFNAHRIHYDRDYAKNEEAYPALVVHGPLLATLLMDHYLRHTNGGPVASFQFRAASPLFDGAPFSVCLRKTESGYDLWTEDKEGDVTMTAKLGTGA